MFREPNKQDATLLFLDYPPPLRQLYIKPVSPQGVSYKPLSQNPKTQMNSTQRQTLNPQPLEPVNHITPDTWCLCWAHCN